MPREVILAVHINPKTKLENHFVHRFIHSLLGEIFETPNIMWMKPSATSLLLALQTPKLSSQTTYR